ncbi:hypothetical protein [Pimelobacter simplex]|uniref:hypothetical protein n=1 Tax=Nocardioides simplex TaxID=2045 RepID=UPI003AAC420A
MPKPRTTMPRLFLEHPDPFGRPGEVRWCQPTSADENIGLRAAELQHHLSLVVADRARASGEPNGRFEQRSGLTAGRLSKLLRGHGQMTFCDLMAIEGTHRPDARGAGLPKFIILIRFFGSDSLAKTCRP